MTQFEFFWSPEGRKVATIKAATLKQAKTEFKKQFTSYARFMGEVYVEFTPISWYAVYRSGDPSRTLLGGVNESRSCRYSHKEDAQSRLDATIDIHGTLTSPLTVTGEVRPSWESPEIIRHCVTAQAVGFVCPECKQIVKGVR